MAAYTLQRVQDLPISIDTAWQFFSSPRNLSVITPPQMGFKILSDSSSDTMYAGQIITYDVRPILGISLFWMTEITHVAPHVYFIDEQRMGPYRLWHHLHRFEKIAGGTRMFDCVNYALPFGLFGHMAHALFVKRQLQQVFDYRTRVLIERFGTISS